MQGLMLFLEVVVVILVGVEIYLRLRARRRSSGSAKGGDAEAELPAGRPAGQRSPTAPAGKAPVAGIPPVQQAAPDSSGAQMVEAAGLTGDDLYQEAAIYMQYGHYSQAATVLRWYVDLQPDDTRAINQLLDAYLALEDLDAYAELLDSLGEQGAAEGTSPGWWRERVQNGLRQDPGNLELLVLAEKAGLPIPPPGENLEEPMTAAKALAIVSRNPDPNYGLAILHAAILEEPLRLPLYAELLRITHQQRNAEGYINGLLLMGLALGEGGATIQERMRRAGMNLGPHPLWDVLAAAHGKTEILRQLAAERQLRVSPKLQDR